MHIPFFLDAIHYFGCYDHSYVWCINDWYMSDDMTVLSCNPNPGMNMTQCLDCWYMYNDICIGFHSDYNIHFISFGEPRFVNNILSKQASYIDIYTRCQDSLF